MPCGSVRLCGISSRFRLLFPCMGQVTHALLTRPPLSLSIFPPRSSVVKPSFDLHVLSTPPAFILSQDRTLMLLSEPVQNNTWLSFPVLFTVFRCCFLQLFPFLSLVIPYYRYHETFLSFSGLSYYSVIKVVLHVILFLNQWFEYMLCCLFKEIFTISFLSATNNILSYEYIIVNNFFILLKQKVERRRRDLNPRAGHPTYTLSRGTSSPT